MPRPWTRKARTRAHAHERVTFELTSFRICLSVCLSSSPLVCSAFHSMLSPHMRQAAPSASPQRRM